MPEEERKEQKTEQPVEHKDVPYEVHKEMADMQERHIRRLIYVIVFLVFIIFFETITVFWFLGQYEFSTETVTVDSTDGIANYLGGDGSITNGNNP